MILIFIYSLAIAIAINSTSTITKFTYFSVTLLYLASLIRILESQLGEQALDLRTRMGVPGTSMPLAEGGGTC